MSATDGGSSRFNFLAQGAGTHRTVHEPRCPNRTDVRSGVSTTGGPQPINSNGTAVHIERPGCPRRCPPAPPADAGRTQHLAVVPSNGPLHVVVFALTPTAPRRIVGWSFDRPAPPQRLPAPAQMPPSSQAWTARRSESRSERRSYTTADDERARPDRRHGARRGRKTGTGTSTAWKGEPRWPESPVTSSP